MIRRKLIGRRDAGSVLRDGAVVALMLGCGLTFAAGPAARFNVDQPAQAMADSLRDIARQTNTSVMFDPARVKGHTSKAVKGQLTAVEALTLALLGSGLEAVVIDDGSIVIRATGPAPGSGSVSAPGSSSAPGGPSEAQVLAGPTLSMEPATTPGFEVGAMASTGSDRIEATASLGTVEVTGSRLRRIDGDAATPVNVYTRKDIERSGQPTLERFLGSLNETSVSAGEGGQGATTGQGTVQLRGLPVGSTLVLINGRRLQAVGSSSGDFFNLNLIPMAAVERVEIVPVGSSAVYGGDALAGVVNIILKKSLDGPLLDARVASAKGTGDRAVSLGTGGHDESGSYLLLAAYSKTTPLAAIDRAFFRDGDYRRLGGVDGRTQSCTPGTVTSSTEGNLPGLGSSVAGIPNLAGRPLTVASFIPTAGQVNLCNPLANGHGEALVYGAETFSLHATGERRLTEAWSAFGEISASRDRTSAAQEGLQLNDAVVGAANPYNPFGEPVLVTARLGSDNGAETTRRSTDFKRVLLGLRGELMAGWDGEVSVSTTRDDGKRLARGSTDYTALDAALNASSPDAAINPFTSGLAGTPGLLQSIWPERVRSSHGRKDQASAFVRGSPITLPSGSIDVIAGVEASRDRYRSVQTGDFDIRGRRSASTVFGEMRAPLWRSAPRLGVGEIGEGAQDSSAEARGREMAALTLAGRRDHYSDFGSASTYQVGLEFRPAKSLLLRGSLATSFKPPTLLQTNVDELSFATEDFGLTDPLRGNAPITGATVLRAVNPQLRPEKGRASSLGVVWEPEVAAGTRMAATAWRVKINGLIALLWPQVVLDNEALFPGLITRGPSSAGMPGAITNVLYTEVNFGSVSTSGVDLEIAHAWKTAMGRWTASVSATRTTRYDVSLAPDSPVEDRLGLRNVDFWSPRWKGRASVGFDAGPWSLGLTSRYLGSYRDMSPGGALGGYWIHDLAASVNLNRAGLRLPGTKDASLSLSIANLGNRLPQYVSTFPYYDVTQSDWRGRYASLRLSAGW